MKIPLWYLVVLLACFFTPGGSDCQGECTACGLLMQQQLQQAFNTMVCLLECEGHVSSSLTWEVCQQAVTVPQYPTLSGGGAVPPGTGGPLDPTSFDFDSGNAPLESAAAHSFQDGDQGEAPFGQRGAQYDSSLLESSEAGEGARGAGLDGGRQPREERYAGGNGQRKTDQDEIREATALSKRFGGFQRGRHGYRKLIGSPARPLQKRYGGFIGVRKSARKWNSQKRVNQLLRQYLGMRSSRSGRFNVPVTRLWRQNKL